MLVLLLVPALPERERLVGGRLLVPLEQHGQHGGDGQRGRAVLPVVLARRRRLLMGQRVRVGRTGRRPEVGGHGGRGGRSGRGERAVHGDRHGGRWRVGGRRLWAGWRRDGGRLLLLLLLLLLL